MTWRRCAPRTRWVDGGPPKACVLVTRDVVAPRLLGADATGLADALAGAAGVVAINAIVLGFAWVAWRRGEAELEREGVATNPKKRD